ncbi:MAG: HAD family phosphatase [Patescibacteria group bacterium]|nr:HAD family phosphatase [Patescibacteria group bacterium]MDE2590289.1 HAD family phosphatase [Patescibacteria group bacterium]
MPLPAFLQNKQAAIFDMDGTMVNNMPYHEKAWRIFAKRHGKELSQEDLRWMFGRKNQEIFPHFFGPLTEKQIETMIFEKEQLYRELFEPEISEVPGFLDVLRVLKQHRILLAIASSAPRENRILIFKHLPIYDYFDTVIGAEDITHGKPHPEVFLKAAGKLGINPKNCVVFEDAPNGIAAAKAAGMFVVGILTTHTKDELYKADMLINDFQELFTIA